MFLNLKKALKFARNNKFAIGAFNVFDLEGVAAVSKAAQELKAPVIIQTTPKAIEYAGLRQLFDLVKNEIAEKNIKAAIHLDHAKDFGLVKDCVDIGYSSVMIDGSADDFDSNVAITKKVVNYAKEYGVNVEGELGQIGKGAGEEDKDQKKLTDPALAKKFVQLTQIDAVAISVGNKHGAPKGEKINLELLAEIANLVDIPIVMHGSSGLPHQDIKGAIKLGVCKFNIDTNLRRAFLAEMVKAKDDPREALEEAIETMSEIVKSYIKLLASDGRADEI